MEDIEKKYAKSKIIFTCISLLSLFIGVLIGVSAASSGKKKGNDKIDMIYELIKDKWLFGNDHDSLDAYLTDLAIMGMTDGNEDPYTFYTSTYAEQNLTIDYRGLGISHAYYGGNRIISTVFKDSPADEAGLKAGDVILGLYESSTSSNLVKFTSLSTQETLDAFTNYEDDTVKMRVEHDGEELDFEIVKDIYTQYAIQNVEVIDGEETTVLVEIQNFMDASMIYNLKVALDEILKEHNGVIDRLIIDLRNNGGGRTDLAADLASLFIPKNSVIVRYQTKKNTEVVYNRVNPYYGDNVKKINFLQNKNTASASEMVILALKENIPEKVDVIGTYSYGKGIRQTVTQFSDGSTLRYTDAYVLPPKGDSIHGKGIKPTIEVKYDYELMNYYGEIGFVTKEYREKILHQINGVLHENYTSYEEALGYFLKDSDYKQFNYEVGRKLQEMGYDMYLDAMLEATELAFRGVNGIS